MIIAVHRGGGLRPELCARHRERLLCRAGVDLIMLTDGVHSAATANAHRRDRWQGLQQAERQQHRNG